MKIKENINKFIYRAFRLRNNREINDCIDAINRNVKDEDKISIVTDFFNLNKKVFNKQKKNNLGSFRSFLGFSANNLKNKAVSSASNAAVNVKKQAKKVPTKAGKFFKSLGTVLVTGASVISFGVGTLGVLTNALAGYGLPLATFGGFFVVPGVALGGYLGYKTYKYKQYKASQAASIKIRNQTL